LLHHVLHLAGTLLTLLGAVVHFLRLCLRPTPVLAAETLFLRKQLAFYQERHVKPQFSDHLQVVTGPVLSGLHHEYCLAKVA